VKDWGFALSIQWNTFTVCLIVRSGRICSGGSVSLYDVLANCYFPIPSTRSVGKDIGTRPKVVWAG
jgi:hypothetical protein